MKTKQSTLALIADHALLPLLLALSALCWYTLGTARYYPDSAASLLAASTKVLVIAAGCAIVTASGGIDVSIAGQISLSLTTMALASSLGAHPALVVLCGVAVGAVCGALNGLLIAVLGVPTFLATLASNFIFSGIARTLITSGISFSFKNFLSRAMDWSVLGVHLDAIIALACLALAWFLTDRTCWGRYVLAVGLDSRAAAASGVHVRRVKWSCYFVSGLFCAVGGIVLSGNEGIAIAAADVKLTLSSLAAIALTQMRLFRVPDRPVRVRVARLAVAVLLLELWTAWLEQVSSWIYMRQMVCSLVLLAAAALGAGRSERFFGKKERRNTDGGEKKTADRGR